MLATYALALLLVTLLGVVAAFVDREVWGTLRELSWTSLGYAVLTALAAAVSLWTFDAVDAHAFRAHEEALHFVFTGQSAVADFHPAEVQALVGRFYAWLGGFGSSMGLFVGGALALGVLGVPLAGVAAHLLTRNPRVGMLTAALLAVHPTLAYWRVHAFHVAPAHALFCATLLLAVLVLRHPSRRMFAAWFLVGALTCFVRIEFAGAVAGTAAVPLIGDPGLLKRVGTWLPGLALAAVLLALPEREVLAAAEQREDYRTGLRFLWLHAPMWPAWRPLSSIGLGVLWLLGLGVLFGLPRSEDRRGAAALLVITVLGILPPLLFIDFGARHALPATTAGIVLASLGAAHFVAVPRQRPIRWVAVALLLVSAGFACFGDLSDLGQRYGNQGGGPPAVDGVERPTEPMPDGWTDCAIYSNDPTICDTSQNCHPVKDMRDPQLVRKRWDGYGGCVYWAVDSQLDDVAGVQHEWWPVVQRLYPLEPAGVIPLGWSGQQERSAEVYRITARP